MNTHERLPVPDPTQLTTEQLLREMAGMKELVWSRLDGVNTRFEEMAKAVHLVQAAHDVFPNRIDEKISALAGVHEERFRSISVQFAERDTRDERTSRDSKLAIDAALQAAKEAVAAQNIASATAIAKSEGATTKQIDQQSVLISTATKGLDDKIDDLKERLTRIEGTGAGKDEAKASGQATGSYVIGLIGLILGTLIGAAGIIFALLHK